MEIQGPLFALPFRIPVSTSLKLQQSLVISFGWGCPLGFKTIREDEAKRYLRLCGVGFEGTPKENQHPPTTMFISPFFV